MKADIDILRLVTPSRANLVATVPLCVGSIRRYELGKDDYIEIRFSAAERIDFHIGDFCFFDELGAFCLVEIPFPTYNEATGGCDYTLRMEADYKLWANHLFKLTYWGKRVESEWKLTDTLKGHVQELLRNVITLDFRHIYLVEEYSPSVRRVISLRWSIESDIAVDEDVVKKGAKLIEYKDIDLLAALDRIAEAFECEWWYDNYKLHFGTLISDEEPMILIHETARDEGDINVESMTRNTSQGSYANRLQVLGGTQNVPENYRKKFMLYPTSITTEQVSGEQDIPAGTYFVLSDNIRPLYTEFFNDANGGQIVISERLFPDFLSNGSKTATIDRPTQSLNAYYACFYADVSFSSPVSLDTTKIPYVNIKDFCLSFGREVNGNMQIRAWKDGQAEPAIDTGAGGGYPITLSKQEDIEYPVVSLTGQVQILHLRIDIFIPEDRIGNDDILDTTLSGQATMSISYQSERYIPARTLAVVDQRSGVVTEGVNFYLKAKYLSSIAKQEVHILISTPVLDLSDYVGRYRIEFPDVAINETKIPVAYYTGDPSKEAARGIAERRLQLPEGEGICEATDGTQYYHKGAYIQTEEYMPESEIVEATEVIDDEFPRETTGDEDYFSIGMVEQRFEEAKEEFSDGSVLTKQIPVYRFKNSDTAAIFDDDWIAEGEKLEVVFQSGLLAGMTFGVAFNPQGLSKVLPGGTYNADAQVFEIVINDTYGRQLPDGILYPQTGDKYLLTGFSPKAMGRMRLVSASENRLLQKGADALQRRLLDGNTYEAVLLTEFVLESQRFITSDGFFFVTADDKYLVTADSSTIIPKAGQRVSLYNGAFGLRGTQNRIIGFEYPLDVPYDHPKVIIGQTPQKRRLRAIEKAIQSLKI